MLEHAIEFCLLAPLLGSLQLPGSFLENAGESQCSVHESRVLDRYPCRSAYPGIEQDLSNTIDTQWGSRKRSSAHSCRVLNGKIFDSADRLIKPIAVRESLRNILFGDIADVAADKGFDFELETVADHLVDLCLPRLLVSEPRILRDLLGSVAILVVQFDRDIVLELTSLEVKASQADEFRVWNRHSHALKSKVDRALFDDAVDVVSPRIVVQEAEYRQFVFIVQSMEHASDASRWLAGAVRDDALVFFPESVFIEALPNRSLFDMQDEFGFAFFDAHTVRFDDARDGVASGTHSGGIEFVFAVDDHDRTGQRTLGFGVKMQLFSHRAGDDFQVLDDRVGFPLVFEGVFLGTVDGMFEHVVQTSDAGRFALANQPRATASNQEGLHIRTGLVQIEQFSPIRLAPHFDQSPLAIKMAIGQRARGDIQVGVPPFLGNLDDGTGQPLQLGHGFDVFSLDRYFFFFFLGATSPLCHRCPLPVMLNFSFCTGLFRTCLGRCPIGILSLLLLPSAMGQENPEEPADAPNPWIATAPPAFARLIDKGQVRIITDDQRLASAGKQALTFFRFDLDYRYRFELTRVRPIADDPTLAEGDIFARVRLTKLIGGHQVILKKEYQPAKPWESMLLQHEFDHVSISTDPRLKKIAEEVLVQPIRCTVRWTKAQGLQREAIDTAIKEEMSARISELERLVQTNYDALDRETRDGQANLRERFKFFQELYSRPWLGKSEFKYLDAIRSSTQDSANKNKEVLEHYLSVESP